jgi:hypothetical protein
LRVLLDGGRVVEDERTREAVGVGHDADENHD